MTGTGWQVEQALVRSELNKVVRCDQVVRLGITVLADARTAFDCRPLATWSVAAANSTLPWRGHSTDIMDIMERCCHMPRHQYGSMGTNCRGRRNAISGTYIHSPASLFGMLGSPREECHQFLPSTPDKCRTTSNVTLTAPIRGIRGARFTGQPIH